MVTAGRAARLEALISDEGSGRPDPGPDGTARLIAFRSPAEGAGWAAALGTEAARVAAYLSLLARTAAFARAAGEGAVTVLDLAATSGHWQMALTAAADAVGEQAGVTLRVDGPTGPRTVAADGRQAGPADRAPLGLLALDLDDPDVVDAATAWLAAPPERLLPSVVVALRSAPAGMATAPSSATLPLGEPASTRLVRTEDRRLARLAGRPWAAGPSELHAVEWACTYHVGDHPAAGLIRLPRRTSGSANRRRLRTAR